MSKLDKWRELQGRPSTSDGEVVFLVGDGDLELHTKSWHFSHVDGQLAII
jgi:hypothetical protein